MEVLMDIWHWMIAFSVFAFPLLLGTLTYLRLRSRSLRLAHIIGFLIAPGLTFYFIRMEEIQSLQRLAQEDGGRIRCGLPVLGAVILMFVGTGLQLAFSLMVQGLLAARRRRVKA